MTCLILDESGRLAGDPDHNCTFLFTSREDAQDFVDFMIYDCDSMGEFEIREIKTLDDLAI